METELIPGLPEEIGRECLLRLTPASHRDARRVSRRWKDLIDNPEFYHERRLAGTTHQVACLVQALPSPAKNKPTSPSAYGITVFDPRFKKWERLIPIPKYPTGLPLFCQLASVEGELVVMGGWDPVTWEPGRGVWVYSFATGRWRRGKDMPELRSFFAAAGARDGRVYVAGGHDKEKNALRSAARYDVRRDEWEEVEEMGEERDECEGVMVGGEFWVVSGYGTEAQGRFLASAEVFDTVAKRWKRVEGGWPEGRCPRGGVGVVGEKGRVVCWAAEAAAAGGGVGTCAVAMGEDAVVVVGSKCSGAPPGFFVLRLGDGQKGISVLECLDVPNEFSGFVQSGCCIEM